MAELTEEQTQYEISYNDIYEKLTSSENDKVIGMIAYSFYKEQKIEYMKSLANGDNVNEKLKEFHKIASLPTQQEKYISDAQLFIDDFVDNIADSVLEQYSNQVNENAIMSKIQATKPHFLTGVFQSFLASFLIVIFTGKLYFLLGQKTFPWNKSFKQY